MATTSVLHLLLLLFHSTLAVLLKRTSPLAEDLLVEVVRTKYRYPESVVNIRVQNGESRVATTFQADLINAIASQNNDWMMILFEDLPTIERRPVFYNVFLVQDYASLCNIISHMNGDSYQFNGYYTVLLEQSDSAIVSRVMEKLWNSLIINVVVICRENDKEYVAYTYLPYQANKCDLAEPIEQDRSLGGSWQRLHTWFREKYVNLNGCRLIAGCIDVKPYSMYESQGNRRIHTGFEVVIAENIASRLNFTLTYRVPDGNIKWGVIRPANSTGLLGMIQRNEVAFGFGSLGYMNARHRYLKLGTASHFGKTLLAIPPRRPYTSLEKLFLPFSLYAWLCVGLCYTFIGILTVAIFNLPFMRSFEPFPNSIYGLWVLLMGGPCRYLRLNSSRLAVMSFILNALVVRTLYHAGMFEKLRGSVSLSSNLDTIPAINQAGKLYYMFKTTNEFYRNNPAVDQSKVRILTNDSKDWRELLYAMSQQQLDGVVALPFACIAYYVKKNGHRGIVYPARRTGITYNTAFHFSKSSSLKEPFDTLVHRFHAAGFLTYWPEAFQDARYWSRQKDDPEPSSLKWNHISGGFFLCGILLVIATVVFFAEIIIYRINPTDKME